MKKFSLKGIYISNLYFVIRIKYFLIFLNFLYGFYEVCKSGYVC